MQKDEVSSRNTLRSSLFATLAALTIAAGIGFDDGSSADDRTIGPGERVAAGKTDRLASGGLAQVCAGQGWGNHDLACSNAIARRAGQASFYHDVEHGMTYAVWTESSKEKHVNRIITF